MKTFKRALSCFLALLMIFGSCSVLSYAALDDGNENTFQVYTKFFVDGEEVAIDPDTNTGTVQVGDTVKARVYLKTDYLISTTNIMFVYPTEFMEFVDEGMTQDTSTDVGDSYDVAYVLNTSSTSTAVLGGLKGYFLHQEGFVLDSMSPADNLVYDGFVNEEYWDDKGWIGLAIYEGKPVVATANDDNDYLVEFTFTVKDTATDDSEGYFLVVEDSKLSADNYYGYTAVERSQPGTAFNTAMEDMAVNRDYVLDLSKDNLKLTIGSDVVEPTTYNVTYSFANEGPAGVEAPTAGTVEANGTIAAPAVEAPAGWTLTWAATGATLQADGSYLAGEGDVAFVGTWAKVDYNVTYTFANEGPAGVEAPAAGKTTVGATIAAPAVEAPAGWTLTWTATGATEADGSYIAGANDVAFVGTWAKVDYNVTYTFANEGPAGVEAPAAGKTTVGATIAAPSTVAPAGWTLTWAVTGATETDGSYIAGANDVTFVGTWAKKSYTITYYLSEEDKAAGKVYDTQTVTFGDPITPIDGPELEGQVFEGWELDFPATMPAENLETFAMISDITVTFWDIFGDPIVDYSLTKVSEITEDDIPSDDDATLGEDVNFVEWQIDGAAFETPYALEGSVDVYPYCEVEIIYYVDENLEDVHKTYTFAYGHVITEEDLADLGTPEKKGYRLDEEMPWDWDFVGEDALMNNYTFAWWIPNEYTATFTAGKGAFAEGVETTVTVEFDSTFTFDTYPVLDGYTCIGWTDVEGGTEALDELVMDAEGKTFYPVFVENGKANYTVEIYLMGTDGKYPETASDKDTSKSGTIGLAVTAAHADYAPAETYFSADMDAANEFTSVVKEDGSTVLKLYFKRAQYDVTIDDATTKAYYGATITAPEATTETAPAGYHFAGWNNGTVAAGAEITVTEAVTLEAYFAPNTDTAYTVEIYLMSTDGKYAEAASSTVPETGTTDTKATATHADYAPAETYFSADMDAANETEVTITGDGKAVLKLYFKRATSEIEVNGETKDYYIGEEIPTPVVDPEDIPDGYKQDETNPWIDQNGDPVEVPYKVKEDGNPTVIKPNIVPKDDTPYTVEIYLMGTDGKYAEAPSSTVPKTGTTDTKATATHADYAPAEAYFSADMDAANETEVTITADGKAALKLYFKRATSEIEVNGETKDYYIGEEIPTPVVDPEDIPDGYKQDETNPWIDQNGDPVEVPYKVKEDGNPTVIKPNIVPKDDTSYTVEIYLMGTDGKYAEAPSSTVPETGTTGTKATATHADYAPAETYFSADMDAANETEVTITGDGKAVLKLYFKRATSEIEVNGETKDYYIGEEIPTPVVDPEDIPDGYKQDETNPWIDQNGDPVEVPYKVKEDGNPTVIKPNIVPKDDTSYTVEIYLQNADGSYPATASKTEDETGKTGETITIAHADYAQDAKYYLADDAQANIFEGEIAGDGSLVLKLYFKRVTYTVAYEYEDGTAIGEATEVRYGAEIEAPAYDTPDGMNFLGWFDKATNEKMPTTMPAKDATYVVKFVAGNETVYFIQVNVMDVDGKNYITTETQALGTTGATQTIVAYPREGFTVNTEKSNLSDTIKGDNSTVLSVFYDRNLYKATFDGVDYPVYFGAALPVVEPAAQEGKEFDKWTPEVPAVMPAENLEFTPTWKNVKYKLIYIINGEEKVYEYAVGETVTPIENPTVPGMTFIGWNKDIPTVMEAKDVIIVAKFEAAVFKVTFLDAKGDVYDEKAVKCGDEIIVPVTNPTKEYNVFKGWEGIPADGLMPDHDLTIRPIFERVPVRLVAANGSTTDINRETMIITGLTTKMNDDKAENYLAVEGDGYYVLTSSAEIFAGFYGTGAKVAVYDRNGTEDKSDDIFREEFDIVIYGDVNGDSAVNSLDGSLVDDEVLFVTNWSRGATKDALVFMAADLNKDGKITTADADTIENTALGITKIDQATGNATR